MQALMVVLHVGQEPSSTRLASEATKTPIAVFSERLVLAGSFAGKNAVGVIVPSVHLLLPISASVLARVPQRNGTNRFYCMYRKIFIIRNWFMQLRRLRSLTIFHLQAGDPGKLVV